jgi:hypothetical protein
VSTAEYQRSQRVDDMSFLAIAMIFSLANLFNMAGSAKTAAAKDHKNRSPARLSPG